MADNLPVEGAGAQERIISGGAALVKLENETQMMLAIQQPRDETKILSAALKELEIYPSLAEEAIYNKPVGKKDGVMQYAEGLSIRTAESLANRWKNSAYGVDIVEEDDDTVTIGAVFLDMENNTRHARKARISKWYTTSEARGKQQVKLTPDRLDLKLKAEGSKLLRETILSSLPAGLRMEYRLKAEEVLKGGEKDGKLEKRRITIVSKFATVGVNTDMLIKYKGKEIEAWQHADIIELLGVFKAIQEGETTVEATFRGEEAQAAAASESTVEKLKKDLDKMKAKTPPPTEPEVIECEIVGEGKKE
jgi:hypothetical protein